MKRAAYPLHVIALIGVEGHGLQLALIGRVLPQQAARTRPSAYE
ncbi:hypothetical protein [Streptomyces sp. NPDC005407]